MRLHKRHFIGGVFMFFACCITFGVPTKAQGDTPYYNLYVDGGEFNGVQYILAGKVINDAFFCDGTYTYYLQYDGTPMRDRLTYHPDGEHIIYFDENGHEVFSDFAHITKSIEGNEVDDNCFFDVYGYMYVNVITYDKEGKKLFYANPFGVLENSGVFCVDKNAMNYTALANGCEYGYANKDGSIKDFYRNYEDALNMKVYEVTNGIWAVADETKYAVDGKRISRITYDYNAQGYMIKRTIIGMDDDGEEYIQSEVGYEYFEGKVSETEEKKYAKNGNKWEVCTLIETKYDVLGNVTSIVEKEFDYKNYPAVISDLVEYDYSYSEKEIDNKRVHSVTENVCYYSGEKEVLKKQLINNSEQIYDGDILVKETKYSDNNQEKSVSRLYEYEYENNKPKRMNCYTEKDGKERTLKSYTEFSYKFTENGSEITCCNIYSAEGILFEYAEYETIDGETIMTKQWAYRGGVGGAYMRVVDENTVIEKKFSKSYSYEDGTIIATNVVQPQLCHPMYGDSLAYVTECEYDSDWVAFDIDKDTGAFSYSFLQNEEWRQRSYKVTNYVYMQCDSLR